MTYVVIGNSQGLVRAHTVQLGILDIPIAPVIDMAGCFKSATLKQPRSIRASQTLADGSGVFVPLRDVRLYSPVLRTALATRPPVDFGTYLEREQGIAQGVVRGVGFEDALREAVTHIEKSLVFRVEEVET